LEHSGLMGETGGNWGGGDWLQNDMGWLGLGVHQFELFERFGFQAGGSLWGGGSLQLLKGLN
jgi:hypothetical protein